MLDVSVRVILIGGTSNSGKSTAARNISEQLGWTQKSTDRLAKHPGRPWGPLPYAAPLDVAEYYLGLGLGDQMASVLGHYQRLWPQIAEIITLHADDTAQARVVLEGSALLPKNVATLRSSRVSAIWLTATDDVFQERIYMDSQYKNADALGKRLIESFIARTITFNNLMIRELDRCNLPSITITRKMTSDEVVQLCLQGCRPIS